MVDWSLKQKKTHQRSRLFYGLKNVDSYLTLMGLGGDIKTGMDMKVLTEKTLIHAVERDYNVAIAATEWLENNWIGNYIFNHNSLSDLQLTKPYDLVFLDYVGNITKRDTFWIKNNLNPNLTKTARLGLTVLRNFRGNKFFSDMADFLHANMSSILSKESRIWRDRGDYTSTTLEYLSVYSVFSRYYLFYGKNFTVNAYTYKDETTPSNMVFFIFNFKEKVPNYSSQEDQIFNSIFEFLNLKPTEKDMKSDKRPLRAAVGHQIETTETDRLIEKLRSALGNYDKMRGFRRALTVHIKKKEQATGTPAIRFLAAFKMRVTKAGLDANLV